jgi:hypothetical protein
MILFRPKISGRAIFFCDSSQQSRACTPQMHWIDGAFSGDMRSRIEIRRSAGEPVKQSLQPFLLRSHQPPRRICLKNPTAPVRLREQRICTFRA